ncbi:hydroxyethylthiazole kinase [Solibacillus sp. FSL H8-0538]|uniref:hydroxyethylthiazole kinase n=1 Tax=Solibacillus sp. FSL H8-0538 TaxID=2921400 RepID=UPI0030F8704C
MTMYKIRLQQPLVHCITNYVVTNFSANGLLAIGASPIMADEVAEMQDMASIVDTLLINIGTLNARTREAMLIAGQTANGRGIPVVLDPVGVGATAYRRETVQELLEKVQFHLIRCNAGELAAIAGVPWQSKGVDSGDGEMDIEEIAKQVAHKYKCLVIVTGPTDLLTDGEKTLYSSGGNALMTQVTGTGCLLSAICAAALTLEGDALCNLQQVLQDYKEVATSAAVVGKLGSFQVEVLNALYKISRGDIG